MAHDLVIRNGTVYDGTGGAPVVTDVGITGDTITITAPLPEHMARTWQMLDWREADVPADPFDDDAWEEL